MIRWCSNSWMRRLDAWSSQGPASRHLAYVIASTTRETRLAIGWSQADLARRAGTSQSTVSRIERGLLDRVDLAAVGRIFDVMGCRLDLRVEAPFLADRRRQVDPAHAQCVAYVVRRLTAAGWVAKREVEISHARSHGWIDVLAYRAADRALLVVEMKTEIGDLGRIERSMTWYEREAPMACRRLGWSVRLVVGALIVLDTRATEMRLRLNRDALVQTFPLPPDELRRLVEFQGKATSRPARAIVAIDPSSRRRQWLRSTILHGRRGPAAYADYAEFMRHVRVVPKIRV
jgi:transcriptional regulator with XRE-family HTH domain